MFGSCQPLGRGVVSGGFAEITPEGTSVLAEQAIPVEDMTSEALQALVEAATAAMETSLDSEKDALAKRLAVLQGLGQSLGL